MIDIFGDARVALVQRGTELWSALFVIIITIVAARLSGRFIPAFLPSASVIRSVVRIAIVAIGLLVALGTFGISIAPALTALGVGGLAVALGLKDTLSNLFAGIALLASRQVVPGDFIRFDGGEGYVVDISWRITTVRDAAGAYIYVPNEKLAQSTLTSFARGGEQLSVPFAVPQATDLPVFLAAVRERLVPAVAHAIYLVGMNEAQSAFSLVIELPQGVDAFAARAYALEEIAAVALPKRAP